MDVEVRNITKRFPGGVVANDEISISFAAGEIHAILGENGAGKSTLMSILSGMLQPDNGDIALDGKIVHFKSPSGAISHGIGMVYQHFMLVDVFSVIENFQVGVQKASKKSELKQKILEFSARYRLKVDPNAKISNLSVGEKQRVEILRMLHRGAQVLILDEPTSVLTPQEVAQLGITLRQLAVEGKTIIFITHKLAEIEAFADRVTVLRAGKVVASLNRSEISLQKLSALMMGDSKVSEKPSFSQLGPEILRLENVSGKTLKGISLSIHAGEIVGIAGISGNGQVELAEVIAGLSQFRGKMYAHGAHVNTKVFIKNGSVRYIPEDRAGTGLALALSVEHNLILRQYQTLGRLLRQGKIREIARVLIHQFNIKVSHSNVSTEKLSGGNRQKVIVARETSHYPQVLVAANPTQGLDIATTQMVHQTLLKMKEAGVALLLLSEDLEELKKLSDRIAVIFRGGIVDIIDPKTPREKIGLLMTGGSK